MGLLHRKKHKRLQEMEPTEFAKAIASTFSTTSKQLVWMFSINGMLWIWCSYILAFLDKAVIAEQLSSNVCTVVIGQMVCYLVTSTIENSLKYNDIFPKKGSPDTAPPDPSTAPPD